MKHIHAEVIKAWADGQSIQCRMPSIQNGLWVDCLEPQWTTGIEYRIKPAAPKWPQTTMTYQKLREAYLYAASVIGWDEAAAMSLANAAIAHACEYGALVPADKVREIEAKARAEGRADTEQRDIAIAMQVRTACYASFPNMVSSDELNLIIAKVKI